MMSHHSVREVISAPKVFDFMRSPLTTIIGAYLTSRIIGSFFVYFGHSKRPYLEKVIGGWEGIDNWWLNPWTTYDSQWFMQIAEQGYQAHTTAFFPLYPWILSIFGPDPVRMAFAGTIISHLAFLAALAIIYKLTKIEWDESVATTTVWLVALSPTAVFFGAVYTESLFLFFLAGTFLAVRQRRWLLAGIFAALASLLRNPGLLIAGALFLEAWHYRNEDDCPAKWYACLLPLVAFIGVQIFFGIQFGSPLAGIVSQEYFHRSPDWPWNPIIGDFQELFSAEFDFVYFLILIISLFFTVVGLLFPVVFLGKVRQSYVLLIFGITLMNLVYARQLHIYTISTTRYLCTLFPLAQIFAVFFVKKASPVFQMVIIGILFFVFIIQSFLFGSKCFLG
jgi:hypothetical protein